MPGLRGFLKKRDKFGEKRPPSSNGPDVQEFTFVRSTTQVEEIISIPDFPDHGATNNRWMRRSDDNDRDDEVLGFRHSANAMYTKDPTARPKTPLSSDPSNNNNNNNNNNNGSPRRSRDEKRLSSRFHFHPHHSRSRSRSQEVSANLPENLPEAPDSIAVVPAPSSSSATDAADATEDREVTERREAQWEKRATMLAMRNPLLDITNPPATTTTTTTNPDGRSRSRSPSISDATGDVNIQDAIRLHEAGELTASTRMFGQLAQADGQNNALAQVLYGLALRHGWGVGVEPERAIRYLSLAASNSAAVEAEALAAGLPKGGAAKGELVLAIFELANCFRHGWGVKVDALAARQFYDTAANLGDTDAMEEAAWCYLEGFGGPRDKFKAAQYLRLAEKRGSKAVGNSWIWKDKYNPK